MSAAPMMMMMMMMMFAVSPLSQPPCVFSNVCSRDFPHIIMGHNRLPAILASYPATRSGIAGVSHGGAAGQVLIRWRQLVYTQSNASNALIFTLNVF